MITRLLVFLIALAMIEFKADFISNMPVMAEVCTTPQKYMEIPIHLTGHQGEETNLLHDNAFAGVLDRISDDRVQGRLHQQRCRLWAKVAPRRGSMWNFQ